MPNRDSEMPYGGSVLSSSPMINDAVILETMERLGASRDVDDVNNLVELANEYPEVWKQYDSMPEQEGTQGVWAQLNEAASNAKSTAKQVVAGMNRAVDKAQKKGVEMMNTWAKIEKRKVIVSEKQKDFDNIRAKEIRGPLSPMEEARKDAYSADPDISTQEQIPADR